MLNPDQTRSQLVIRMGLRALMMLLIIIVAFVLIKKLDLKDSLINWLTPLTDRPWLVYTIFVTSESYIGIMPPEVFMMLSLDHGWEIYAREVLFLAILSNIGGFIGFSSGKYLSNTRLVKRMIHRQSAEKYIQLFEKYGGTVVLLAAVTPLPFAMISIMAGSLRLSNKKYILNALPRILRFIAYGYFVWMANQI